MKNKFHSPKGFLVSGIHCGLKAGDQKDLALIYSQSPCRVAFAFTTNKVKAAPVVYCQQVIQGGGTIRAVVVNSGNANACTGLQGLEHTRQEAEVAAELFEGRAEEVLVLSTGVIGVPLPVGLVLNGIMQAGEQVKADSWEEAAQAIITTDTQPKIACLKSPAGYTITGIAKGAGMISPNMATMLAVICTDADLSAEMLAQIQDVWNLSFNRIVVDGDMSTNDTVVLLANGASGVEAGTDSDFFDLCLQVCTQLAQAIVQDGEGATKLVTVKVSGTNCRDDAEQVARAIATSPLCKTAFYGADPNWGRIICAAGYAGIDFDPDQTSLYLSGSGQTITLFENGCGVNYNEAAAIKLMQENAWEIQLEFGQGEAEYWLWTCDLSHDYVTINGHYRT